jgi:hypothetical protein
MVLLKFYGKMKKKDKYIFMQNFEYPFKKVIGANNQQIDELKNEWNEKTQEYWDDMRESVSKNLFRLREHDKAIIDSISSGVSEMVKLNGGEMPDYDNKNLFIVKNGSVKQFTGGDVDGGVFDSKSHAIMVDRNESDIVFANSLAHELFHLAGYKSLKVVGSEKKKVDLYRNGITMIDTEKGKTFFSHLEEAIIAEANYRFHKKNILTNPIFKGEIENTEFIKGWLKRLFVARGMKKEHQKQALDELLFVSEDEDLLKELRSNKRSEKQKIDYLGTYMQANGNSDIFGIRERDDERIYLQKIVERISQQTGKSKNEIMEKFLEANFSGKLLELSRLVEDVFGKGSFRDIAEKTAYIHQNKEK